MLKVAVVSGKGGVGKTTVSLAMAKALTEKGKVGLFDADITGANTHLSMYIVEDVRVTGNKLIPAKALIHGQHPIDYVSIALVSDAYIKWSGNTVEDFITQLMEHTEWNVDYLIIDCPPGSHEDTVKSIELSDVVVFVTIPTAYAYKDLERSIDLVKDIGKPVAGVYVNFSKAICPECGAEFKIFDVELDYEIPVIEHIPFTETDRLLINSDLLLERLQNPVVLKKKSLVQSAKRNMVKAFLRGLSRL